MISASKSHCSRGRKNCGLGTVPDRHQLEGEETQTVKQMHEWIYSQAERLTLFADALPFNQVHPSTESIHPLTNCVLRRS